MPIVDRNQFAVYIVSFLLAKLTASEDSLNLAYSINSRCNMMDFHVRLSVAEICYGKKFIRAFTAA